MHVNYGIVKKKLQKYLRALPGETTTKSSLPAVVLIREDKEALCKTQSALS